MLLPKVGFLSRGLSMRLMQATAPMAPNHESAAVAVDAEPCGVRLHCFKSSRRRRQYLYQCDPFVLMCPFNKSRTYWNCTILKSRKYTLNQRSLVNKQCENIKTNFFSPYILNETYIFIFKNMNVMLQHYKFKSKSHLLII